MKQYIKEVQKFLEIANSVYLNRILKFLEKFFLYQNKEQNLMKLGIIGAGNMGSSILKGVTSSNFLENKNVAIFDLDKEKIEELSKEYGVKKAENENELAKESDILILSVKPNVVPKVLDKIKDDLLEKTIVLSIAAGISIDFIENIIGTDKKVIRTMPNTPAQVMEGMTAVSFNQNIQENEKSMIFKLLNSFGKSIEIEEKLMHAYTGISGSLPAYVYVFMEALADGGVLEGMPRDKAYEIIAQTVLGSAKMMLETKKHPGVLKDEVTSPGGTTIAALKVLEDGKFRGTIMEAVKACTEKSKEMAGE